MISLTRLNGAPFAVNSDLIERVDATPDTVLTLVDGTKYLVLESIGEVVAAVRSFRAAVIAEADFRPEATGPPPTAPLRVVTRSDER